MTQIDQFLLIIKYFYSQNYYSLKPLVLNVYVDNCNVCVFWHAICSNNMKEVKMLRSKEEVSVLRLLQRRRCNIRSGAMFCVTED